MRPLTPTPRFAALLALMGTLGAAAALAQVDLPPLQATTRPTLERPRSYEPPARATTSSSRRTTSGKIPDPSIFDGSAFPPEERPERGLIAQFEMPGQEQPSSKNVQGPGDKQGGGGQGPGGDSQMGGGGGPQMGMGGLNIPGIPGMGGGGGAEGDSMPQMPSLAGGGGGPPPIEEGDMGDRGKEGQGGIPGEGGEEGDPQQAGGEGGAPGAEDAPKVAAGQKGRALEKPQAMQIGDQNAKLAETNTPTTEAGRQLDSEQGEDRMSVKSASGNQTANRGTGTERGVDIPSNL